MVTVAVVVASLFEIIPTFLIRSNVPTIASVTPYTPLELVGRDIYVSEGCYNCHSQMVRPIRAETERYGEYSKPGEFVYDHPFQWGSRRIGPDLHRVGGKYPHLWHVRHMEDPRSITPGLDHARLPVAAARPTSSGSGSPRRCARSAPSASPTPRPSSRARSSRPGRRPVRWPTRWRPRAAPPGSRTRRVVALIAYLQRLGTDLNKPEPAPVEAPAGVAPARAEFAEAAP